MICYLKLAFPHSLRYLNKNTVVSYYRLLFTTPCYKFSHSSTNEIFLGEKDRYNGITIDCTKYRYEPQTFAKTLTESLHVWLAEGKRCVWFKVNIKDSLYVPILAQKGFNFHHARDDFVMMYKWLPIDIEHNLPPSCHTNLGVGAIVFNNKKQLLAVSEKHYEYPHWKLPGGYVERGEDIIDAAVREVREETGVNATFESLITFRHTHNMMYGNSDIYVLLMMKAFNDRIILSQREVKDCRWMDVEEYTTHPHVHDFNKLIVKKALDYKDKGIKLNIEKKTVKWAQYVRDMNYLAVEDWK